MTKKHLGGHADITHIDDGILEMAKKLNFKTMLDIGCGPGGMVQRSKEFGIMSEGIDGYPGKNQISDIKINIHDFTIGKFDHQLEFDLAWSCEFVEHVEERYLPNFMHSFQKCKNVFMTYAPPGTPGHHHVNCRPEQYWKDVFYSYGFVYDEELTKELRNKSTMKRDFVRKCGLVFRRKTDV